MSQKKEALPVGSHTLQVLSMTQDRKKYVCPGKMDLRKVRLGFWTDNHEARSDPEA